MIHRYVGKTLGRRHRKKGGSTLSRGLSKTQSLKKSKSTDGRCANLKAIAVPPYNTKPWLVKNDTNMLLLILAVLTL